MGYNINEDKKCPPQNRQKWSAANMPILNLKNNAIKTLKGLVLFLSFCCKNLVLVNIILSRRVLLGSLF